MIIQLANNLIAHNKTRTEGKQPLVAHKLPESSPAVSVKVYDSEVEELVAIAETIKDAGWNPEDCAILARTTKILQAAAQELDGGGLKAYLSQRKNEFECPSIRWLHAALRLANARHDREFLRRMCVAWESFAEVLIEVNEVEAMAAIDGGDFLRAWVTDALGKSNYEPLVSLLKRIQADLVEKLSFVELIEWFWNQGWIDDPLEKEEIATWQELHGALMREHGPENITLNLYLQEMDLKSKAAPRQQGAVSCLTVHGSKGMEFKHVFLVGMADEVFPSYQAIKKGADSKELEEERRNCFVAITRVEETLRISWSRIYNGWGKRPSRFIEEMGFKFKK
jgi:DNA helicase II / ATP-dependent DNA helicase PcrA